METEEEAAGAWVVECPDCEFFRKGFGEGDIRILTMHMAHCEMLKEMRSVGLCVCGAPDDSHYPDCQPGPLGAMRN